MLVILISKQITFEKPNRISFKNYIFGADIIENIFDFCNEEDTYEGLTLKEVKERHCMDHLTATLGMLDDNIARDFEAIDENGDGFVSKQESFNAYETLGMDRKGDGKSNENDNEITTTTTTTTNEPEPEPEPEPQPEPNLWYMSK